MLISLRLSDEHDNNWRNGFEVIKDQTIPGGAVTQNSYYKTDASAFF